MARRKNSRIFDHLNAVGARLRGFVDEIKAGLDALHRVQFDEPWNRAHRPTYEEWQDFIAPRPTAPRPMRASGPSAPRAAWR